MHKTSFDWFGMDLPLVLCEGFHFVVAYKKDSRLILENLRIIYLVVVKVISVKFLITPQID